MPFVSCKILAGEKIAAFLLHKKYLKCVSVVLVSVWVLLSLSEISVLTIRKIHKNMKGGVSLPFFPLLSQNTHFSVDEHVSLAEKNSP